MIDATTLGYLGAIAVAIAAAVAPAALRAMNQRAPERPPFSVLPQPVDAEPVARVAYDRAAWVNECCDLVNVADSLGQADVATAGRALIAALVAVKELKS